MLQVHIHACGTSTLLVCRHFLVISSHECCSYQLHFEWLVDLSHLAGWSDAFECHFLEDICKVESWKWNRVLRNRTGRRKPVYLFTKCGVVEFGTTSDKSRSQWSERDLNPNIRAQFAIAPTLSLLVSGVFREAQLRANIPSGTEEQFNDIALLLIYHCWFLACGFTEGDSSQNDHNRDLDKMAEARVDVKKLATFLHGQQVNPSRVICSKYSLRVRYLLYPFPLPSRHFHRIKTTWRSKCWKPKLRLHCRPSVRCNPDSRMLKMFGCVVWEMHSLIVITETLLVFEYSGKSPSE